MLFTANTFRALGSKTRLEILKKLKSRRMTLSELSDVLGMHASTVSEHLAILERAELVLKNDEGYKWKYYSLTKDGERLFFPKDTGVVLPIGIILIISGLWDSIMQAPKTLALQAAEKSMAAGATNISAPAIAGAEAPYMSDGGLLLVLAGVLLVSYVAYRRLRKHKY